MTLIYGAIESARDIVGVGKKITKIRSISEKGFLKKIVGVDEMVES